MTYKGTAPVMQMYISAAWVDVTADVRIMGMITAFWGVRNNDPISTRLAEPGSLAFTLENSYLNSGGLTGYYSPDHSNLRAGFGLGTKVRIKLTSSTGSFYKLFYISKIDPAWGENRDRSVQISATDYMGKMQTQFANELIILTDQGVDDALAALVASMPVAPVNTSYATAPDTLTYIFQDVDSRKTTIFNMAQRLLQTDLGFVFCDGDATDGETLTYESRHTRLVTTSSLTIDNEILEMPATRSESNIYNNISVIANPLNIGSSDEVLWQLQKELTLNPGDSITMRVRFRDPSSQGTKVTMAPDTEVTPVADTDYKFSSSSGSGNDLNASLGISITYYADNALVTYTNNSATTAGYLWLAQLRGRIVRQYDPAEATNIDTAENLELYGNRALRFALPYLDNPNTAQDFADHFFTLYSAPATAIEFVEINGNYDQATWDKICGGLIIGDRITLTEAVTGISAIEYTITGIELTIMPGNQLKAKYYLALATGGDFWFLGTSGLSELGETTILGF